MESLAMRGDEGQTMEGRASRARWALFAVLGLFAAGCGRRPYMIHAPMQPAPEPTTIVIVVQDGEVEDAQGARVEIREEAPEEGWVPSGLPRANPFERTRTWKGDYDCVQGNTGFALRVMDVRGRVMRAIFDFHHAPTGVSGSYLLSGTYDPATRRVDLSPTRWIVQPDDYVMTGMEGEVAEDGSLFAGRINFPGCGAFHLKPTR